MSEESMLEQWALDDSETARELGRNYYDLSDAARAEPFFRDAFRIMRDALGFDWIVRELDPDLPSGYLLLGANSDDEPSIRVERSHRIANLALALYDARRIRGFENLAAELRRRQLYEAVAELRAVNHMLRVGEGAWFVDPHERAGHTCDGVVVLNGIEVAVEVKAKLPQPVDAFRPKLIENSLRSARKQLPDSAPSIIYLYLASPWTEDAATMRATDEAIRNWLDWSGQWRSRTTRADLHIAGRRNSLLAGKHLHFQPGRPVPSAGPGELENKRGRDAGGASPSAVIKPRTDRPWLDG